MPEAAVIGAGPNGLAAAVVLAQAGRSVVLYERSSFVGGASSTRELTVPGFRHDLGAAVHPLGSASPLFRSLSHDQHGLEWLRPEIPLAHPLDGGRAVTLDHSITVTAEQLDEDGPLYQRVVGGLSRRWNLIESAAFGPVLRVPDHPLALVGLGLRGLLPAAAAAGRLRTTEGRALLAGLAAHAPMPLDKPGNTAVALVLAALGHVTGWPVARGGSQSIADALAVTLADLGGSIETDHAIDGLAGLPATKAVLLDTGPLRLWIPTTPQWSGPGADVTPGTTTLPPDGPTFSHFHRDPRHRRTCRRGACRPCLRARFRPGRRTDQRASPLRGDVRRSRGRQLRECPLLG